MKKQNPAELKQDELLLVLGFDNSETLRQRRLEALEDASKKPLFSTTGLIPAPIKYPNIYISTSTTPFSMYGSVFTLPVGTIR